jgi:hypothetical protein
MSLAFSHPKPHSGTVEPLQPPAIACLYVSIPSVRFLISHLSEAVIATFATFCKRVIMLSEGIIQARVLPLPLLQGHHRTLPRGR